MLLVDDRTGSIDLAGMLRGRRIPTELTRLEYGDVSLIGNGPEGRPVPVGIEVKQITDILKCMTDGRFAGHQLPGLLNSYEVVWLLLEGNIRADHSGLLEIRHHRGGWYRPACGRQQFMYRELDHYLQTLAMKGGVRIKQVSDRHESVQWLCDLYSWWTAKEWEEHRSHLAFDLTNGLDAALLTKPNIVRRIAKELPGIGWSKSDIVSRHFPTVFEMVMAGEKEWATLPGIGPTMAKRIVKVLTTRQ